MFTGATTGSTTPTSMNSDAIASSVGVDLVTTPVHRETVPRPTLTEEQTRQAFSVIPSDYLQPNCRTCRDCGQSTLTCPTPTPNQRMYFAYLYYLDQIKWNPRWRSSSNRRRKDEYNLRKNEWSKTLNTPEMSTDPDRPPNTRYETITSRIPWRAGPTNNIPFITITTNVKATAATEVSVEDVDEEEAYISATDGEHT